MNPRSLTNANDKPLEQSDECNLPSNPSRNIKFKENIQGSNENDLPEGSVWSQKRLESSTIGSIAADIQEANSTQIGVPTPSIIPNEYRGKSITQWGIVRRRDANALKLLWMKASEHIDTTSFPVFIYPLVRKIDEYFPKYRDVPSEDSFSGILQLIRNSLTGPNFDAVQQKKLTAMFDKIFEIIIGVDRLGMSHCLEIQRLIQTNGLCPNAL